MSVPDADARDYALLLDTGEVVLWSGTSPEEAARRYAAGHRLTSIVAWRPADWHGVQVWNPATPIIDGLRQEK